VDIAALLAGDTSSASYTLSDMAQDTVGLLDALKLRSAHIVGASMGGAIGQAMAIEHPERMRTFTSIMSTTGDPSVGQPTQQALAVLLAPRPMDRDGAIEHVIANYRVIGSPASSSTRCRCASEPDSPLIGQRSRRRSASDGRAVSLRGPHAGIALGAGSDLGTARHR
jgi:pimeloyl-ACP methyl ester carboxylesterase